MKPQYYPPEYGEKQFHCPLCHVFASQSWHSVHINTTNNLISTAFEASYCSHCRKWAFWYDGRLMVPNASPVEVMHPDLPKDCQDDYEEAKEIVSCSPRGAVALLRLCLQKLMLHLGEAGININDDINSLVAKGLPSMVQQALDVCRVVGNNAVHPGELDIHDTPDIAHQLFRMINFIVADRITRPKEIQALYDQLPIGANIAGQSKRDLGAPGK